MMRNDHVSAPGRSAMLVRRLLRLYPRAWRDRYSDEVATVLSDHRVTVWTALDMLLGAVDAHLHQDLLPGRLQSMSHQMRSSLLAIFGAVALFSIAWLPLRLVRDPLPIWRQVTALHPELFTTLTILDVGGGIAALAVLVGGGPIVFTAFAQAVATRHWRILALFGVPLLAVATLVVYALIAFPASTARQSSAGDAPFTLLAVALQLGFVILLLGAIGGSVAAITAAIGRSELSEGLLRFALVFASIATAALILGLIGAIMLTVFVLTEAPQVSSSPLLHGGDLLLMFAAVVLAGTALQRGLQSARRSAATT